MQELNEISGMSKQNLYKHKKRDQEQELFHRQLLELVIEVRKDHPRMSARKIHKMLNLQDIGINKFEQFVSISGLKVQKYRSVIKTTRSGRFNYPNLTYGLELDFINQLWAGDITYFITPVKTYYIVLLIDVYSRRVVGFSASDNMFADNNVRVLTMAIRMRKQKYFNELIHHSDKGSQYGSTAYLAKLNNAGIKVSMAENSLENAYAERINGIIKNEYLIHENINSLKQLKTKLKQVIKLYNEKRPHIELGYLSPINFEKKIKDLPERSRPKLKLYDFRNSSK
ncbi:MAG: IS3 family transposase [Bacteroidales bacterium]|nr:IS3 family transposase [Bacteroidales bacterium]